MRRRNIHSSDATDDQEEIQRPKTRTKDAKKMRLPYGARRRARNLATFLAKLAIVTLIVIFVGIPLAWHNIPAVSRNLIFLPFVSWPPFLNLKEPAKLGLIATRNYYVQSEPGVQLGVWHALPKSSMFSSDLSDEFYEKSFSNGSPVVLYMHGNSGTRGGSHRIELYKVLRELDFHVVTFDYRGYGDSTSTTPSEEGVVRDSRAMYKYLRKLVGKAPLFIWGHSLGTGVATEVTEALCAEGDAPAGLVLEAPFNNMKEEVRSHPLSKFWRSMPLFDWFFLQPLDTNMLNFTSDDRISKVDIPILILHAEDDPIIPLNLGYKLYQAAISHRPSDAPAVQFIRFDGHRGYAHRYICRDPGLPKILTDFTRYCETHSRQ